jgi:hypothetical protein
MWERDINLTNEISLAWKKHDHAISLQGIRDKLKSTMSCLQSWSSLNFGAVTKEITKLKKDLERLQSSQYARNRGRIDNINRRLDELLLREEIMWKQRSRVSWLKHGDQNTRYFHRKACWRAKKNRIKRLKREDGSFEEKPEELEKMAKEYFDGMYTKDTLVTPELIEELITPMIDEDTNKNLIKEFTNEKISDALFQIGPLKAPGADGFPARFFQRN